MRLAAAYSATGRVPELDDPFDPSGAKFFHKEENGKMKIWSAGQNGKNDGSSGDDFVRAVPILK